MQKLTILWTNAEELTSKNMVLMYSTNAKRNGWWDEITVVIWGATAKLVAENQEIQLMIQQAQEVGVHFSACKVCAQNLLVHQELVDLNIEVVYWGAQLTDLIKNKEHLLTI